MSANNTELFLMSLRSLRDTLQSAATQISTILELADRPIQEEEPSECPHPMAARENRAVMGHPHRFFCRKCQTLVD